MTSGISAKGSALGADGSESGVVPSRAPLPRASGNGTKRSHQASTGTNFQEAGIAETPETSAGSVLPRITAAESSHPAMSSSVRTLILGIDYDGRIVQHDRNAAKILAREPEDLLGAQLIELTSAGTHGIQRPAERGASEFARRPAGRRRRRGGRAARGDPFRS